MEHWLREHTTAHIHGPTPTPDGPIITAYRDPMILGAHVPKYAKSRRGVTIVVIGKVNSRHIDHEGGCSSDDGEYRLNLLIFSTGVTPLT